MREQSGVAQALVLADERTQLLRDGKGDQEVVAWELAFDSEFGATVGICCVDRWGSGDCRRSPRTVGV